MGGKATQDRAVDPFCLCGAEEGKPSFFPRFSVHVSTSLPFPASFALLAFHLSPCFALPSFHPSASPPLRPRRHASFDGLCPLLSSSRCVQLVFSQDASLQVLLHQNGTEREREGDDDDSLRLLRWRSCSDFCAFAWRLYRCLRGDSLDISLNYRRMGAAVKSCLCCDHFSPLS